MKDWDGHSEPNTWGGLVAYAKTYGAHIEVLPEFEFDDGRKVVVKYLCRDVGERTLKYPIPAGCTPERRVGPRRWMSVCARLEVPEPDWAIEF